jgi:hypothetical protein
MVWTTGRSRFDSRHRQEIFPLTCVPRPALGPTDPLCNGYRGGPSPGLKRGWGVTLTTHPHPVPRSWMSRSYTFSLPSASIGVLWDCFSFIVFRAISYYVIFKKSVKWISVQLLDLYIFETYTCWYEEHSKISKCLLSFVSLESCIFFCKS